MQIENYADIKGIGRVHFVFEKTNSYENYENIKQSYGLCFNKKGEIIIVRSPGMHGGRWILPGGSIEKGETPEDTLHREVMEEADITIENVELLGGQRAYLLDKKNSEVESQLRFVCLITELLPQTSDPDNGFIPERKFINPLDLNKYLDWGEVSVYLGIEAKEWFEDLKK